MTDGSRQGISQQDVWTAADALDQRGINPTLSKVREELGRGSFSTISAYMQEWKQKRSEKTAPAVEPPPEDLNTHMLDMGHKVWHIALTHAQQRHEGEAQQLRQQITERDQAVVEANEAGDTALAQLEQKTREAEQLGERLSVMEAQAAHEQQRADKAEQQRDAQAARDGETIERLRGELQTANAEVRDTGKALARLEAERDSQARALTDLEARHAEELERLSGEVTRLRTTLEQAQAELQTARGQLDQATREVERLTPLAEKAAELEAQRIKQDARLESAQANAQRAEQDAEEARQRLSAAQERASKAEGALEALKAGKTPQRRSPAKSGGKAPAGGAKGDASPEN